MYQNLTRDGKVRPDKQLSRKEESYSKSCKQQKSRQQARDTRIDILIRRQRASVPYKIRGMGRPTLPFHQHLSTLILSTSNLVQEISL